MEQLLDILRYKREVLSQLLVVASIFGGFAVSGVMGFLSSSVRGRLANAMYVALSVAALAFVSATLLDAIMLPSLFSEPRLKVLGPDVVRALTSLGDVVVWLVLLGSASLVGAVASSGFLYSRRVGQFVLAGTLVLLVVLAASLSYLARLLG